MVPPRRFSISEATASMYAMEDMSPQAQFHRHAQSGRPILVTIAEESEVIRRAREERAAHRVVDKKWTRQAFAAVTHGACRWEIGIGQGIVLDRIYIIKCPIGRNIVLTSEMAESGSRRSRINKLRNVLKYCKVYSKCSPTGL
jgi:hypothetical protein